MKSPEHNGASRNCAWSQGGNPSGGENEMVTSAGSTSGEELFLELRLGVLKGDYLPGQVFDRSEVCDLFGCTPRVVGTAFTTLVSEGYLFCPSPDNMA